MAGGCWILEVGFGRYTRTAASTLLGLHVQAMAA